MPTDAERAVAFPDVGDAHLQHMMDSPPMLFLMLDRFEWVDTDDGSELSWDASGWYGDDEQRLWFRSEGDHADGDTESAELQLLYGKPIARWWDFVAGVRHDFEPGPSLTWLAAGLQGLAPYWFETEATFYLGGNEQTALRLEAEYELLLTNRLILQPSLEIDLHGKDDARRGIGSGLSNTEAGLRLRYEIRREIAPYIGVTWDKAHGDTADFRRLAGENDSDTALVAGIRLWY